MRVLVLWADDRSSNLGVRVLAAGTAALVRSVWPQAEVVFHNYGASSSPTRLGDARAVVKEVLTRREGLRDWVTSFDLVVDTRAGDSFADIYGMKRLVTQSLTSELVGRWGVPLVLGPQTHGPFRHRSATAVGRRVVRRADLVMARDHVSAQVVADLGSRPPVRTTDVVFALPAPPQGPSRDVLLNVSGLLWQGSPHVDAQAYRTLVTQLYGALRGAGREVALLAHVIDSADPDNDVPAVREFARATGEDPEVVVPTSLEDVRSAVQGANLVIGSRMHACLNALSVGTPAIALAYSRKFAPLLEDIGWEHSIDLGGADPAVVTSRILQIAASTDLADQADKVGRHARTLLGTAREALGSLELRTPVPVPSR